MLKKAEADIYYQITCSRGEGSETITIEYLPLDDPERGKWTFDSDARRMFDRFGVALGEAEYSDEGFLVLVPAGTKPLTGVFCALMLDIIRYYGDDNALLKRMWNMNSHDMFREFIRTQDEWNHAYLSAMMRCWLQDFTKPAARLDRCWTSSNGWRKVDLEVMNRPQFELLVNSLQIGYDEIEMMKCAVIKRTIELARKCKLPEQPFSGC